MYTDQTLDMEENKENLFNCRQNKETVTKEMNSVRIKCHHVLSETL
jgi:hypothetical protein